MTTKRKAIVLAFGIVMAAALVAALVSAGNGAHAQGSGIAVGDAAPNYGFVLANGTAASLSAYRGNTLVLWFVATWCSTCAQGNEALNSSYAFFMQHGVKIIELELYNDLGYEGPGIAQFVGSYAPAAYSNGTILPAIAGYNMSAAYDPKGYLDIYYLISGSGRIMYINEVPAATLPQLKQAIINSS